MAKAMVNRKKSASVASQVLDAVVSLLPRKKATKRRENKNEARGVSAKSRGAQTTKAAKTSSGPSKALAKSKAPAKRSASPGKTASKRTGVSAKSTVARPSPAKVKSKSKSGASKNAKSAAVPKTTIYAELLEAKKAAAKPAPTTDAAHAPGHRRLPIAGLKKTRTKVWQNSSVVNNNAADDRIARNESAQRNLLPSSTTSKARRGNY